MAHGYPDFEGDKAGLYLKPEWAAKEGTDKNLYLSDEPVAPEGFVLLDYVVPASKTLYIVQSSYMCHSNLPADGDANQFSGMQISDNTTGSIYVSVGSNGGTSVVLSQPIVIPSGHTARVVLYNWANHNVGLYGAVQGYEV